jgi:hypothetical protein
VVRVTKQIREELQQVSGEGNGVDGIMAWLPVRAAGCRWRFYLPPGDAAVTAEEDAWQGRGGAPDVKIEVAQTAVLRRSCFPVPIRPFFPTRATGLLARSSDAWAARSNDAHAS